MYTKSEKEELIKRFQLHLEERKTLLRNEYNTLSLIIDSKISKRINRVPKRLWDVKMKDILEVERDHKPIIANLLADIASLKNNSQEEVSSSQNESSAKLSTDDDIERMKLQLRNAIKLRKNMAKSSSPPSQASSSQLHNRTKQ